MKIVLIYQEPKTNLSCYRYKEIFNENESQEALEAFDSVKRAGYEIVTWTLVHDGDEWKLN